MPYPVFVRFFKDRAHAERILDLCRWWQSELNGSVVAGLLCISSAPQVIPKIMIWYQIHLVEPKSLHRLLECLHNIHRSRMHDSSHRGTPNWPRSLSCIVLLTIRPPNTGRVHYWKHYWQQSIISNNQSILMFCFIFYSVSNRLEVRCVQKS